MLEDNLLTIFIMNTFLGLLKYSKDSIWRSHFGSLDMLPESVQVRLRLCNLCMTWDNESNLTGLLQYIFYMVFCNTFLVSSHTQNTHLCWKATKKCILHNTLYPPQARVYTLGWSLVTNYWGSGCYRIPKPEKQQDGAVSVSQRSC